MQVQAGIPGDAFNELEQHVHNSHYAAFKPVLSTMKQVSRVRQDNYATRIAQSHVVTFWDKEKDLLKKLTEDEKMNRLHCRQLLYDLRNYYLEVASFLSPEEREQVDRMHRKWPPS